MASVYEFCDNIFSIRAIKWSADNRISITTSTTIKCLALNCSVDNTDNKVNCMQSYIRVSPDVFDIAQYSEQDYKMLIKLLRRDDRRALTIDQIVNPYKFPEDTLPRTGFAASEWSPLGADQVGRCIQATLSFDHRVCLYSQCSRQFDWFKICDLSEMLRKQAQPNPNLKTANNFHEYRRWCQSIATSAISWCPNVLTDDETKSEFGLLALATVSGNITFCKVRFPCLDESHISILQTVCPHQGPPMCMSWTKDSGHLAVGYVDGQVHILSVDLTNCNTSIQYCCVYGKSDMMRVSCMTFTKCDKMDSHILVVNKEHCVVAFKVENQEKLATTCQMHCFGENVLAGAEMLTMKDNRILFCSQDAQLQMIQVKAENDGMSVSCSKLELSLPPEIVSMCAGACLSPSNIFIAYALRPQPGFDHLAPIYKRKVTRVYIKCLDDFDIGTSHSENIVATMSNNTAPFGRMLDYVQLLRSHVLSNGSLNLVIDKQNNSRQRIYSKLKLQRFVAMLKMNLAKSRINSKRRLDQDAEDITTFERLGIESMCQLLCLYIIDCIQLFKTLPEQEPLKKTDTLILQCMQNFFHQHADKLSHIEDSQDTRQCLDTICQRQKHHMQCGFCASDLKIDGVYWKCTKDHLFYICVKTFMPIDFVGHYTCTICKSHAKSIDLTKEIRWLIGDLHRCTLCDGLML